jgi:hypothetical protein
VLALIALVVIAGIGWRLWRTSGIARVVDASAADTTQAGMKAVTLFFPDASGDSLVSEIRQAAELDGLHEQLAQLVGALASGPEHRGVAVLPAGTEVLHAYLDDRGLLTLDVSRAFQQGFGGGSREEDLVVTSLVRTIAVNLPQVKLVLITCGGAPIASLGGHLPLDRPIDPNAAP